MLRYKIDGIMFKSPINGLNNMEREIFRELGTNSDAVLSARTVSTVTFTGSAYRYLCENMASLCKEFTFEKIADDNSVEYQAVFYSHGIVLEHDAMLATVQLKETSWAAVLRNRTNIPVFLSSFKSIECDPIERPVAYAIDVYKGDGNLQTVNYRYGLDVLDVLDYLVKYLTNGAMYVTSGFFSNNHYAIFSGEALGKYNFDPIIPGRNLSRRDIYPTMSFDWLFENLRKIFGVFIEINGNEVVIEHESYFYDDENELVAFSNIPKGLITNIAYARMFSTVNVGGPLDKMGEEEDDYNTFPQKSYFAFNQETYSSCSCESDKNNNLNLNFDMYVDSSTVLKVLATGGKTRDDIFLIEYVPTDATHPITREGYLVKYNIGSKIYYNDTLRNINIIPRWESYVSGCLYNSDSGDEVFLAECGAGECENQYRTMITQPTGVLLGRLFFADPGISIDPDSVDAFSGWINRPGNINQNSVMTNQYSGYEIQIPMAYAFTARSALMVGPHFNIIDVEYSIAIYEDASLTNELYRTSIFEHYEDIENTEFLIYEISTDVLDLDVGNIAVVEVRTSFEWSGRLTLGDVFWYPMRFFIDTDLISCGNTFDSNNHKPYIHDFTVELCQSDFVIMQQNKRGYISVNGKKCYIRSVSRDSKNIARFVLISDENICESFS